MKTGILLVFLSCTYTIHIAHSLSLRRAMPLSYLYVYDLCFSIPSPSGGDVSAKIRKILIPASDPKNSFSATRSPRPLPEHLRSVPLSALRVQRYNFSHSPQALSRQFLKEISHCSDNQKSAPPLNYPTRDRSRDPAPIRPLTITGNRFPSERRGKKKRADPACNGSALSYCVALSLLRSK